MLDPRVSSLGRRLLPRSISERLDPFETAIQNFVSRAAGETRPGAIVLDAGAGECRFRDRFQNARYIGLDFALGDPNWDYSRLDLIGRLEAIPIASGRVDAVLSVVVLEHTPEPAAVLREFARVLASHGRVYLVVPHMWEEHQKPYDFFRYTSAGIRYLMESAGFSVTRIDPVGGFFWQLGRRFIGVLGFAQEGWRWVLMPVLAPVFGLALPLVCFYLDRIDRDRSYTLGFVCEGVKP